MAETMRMSTAAFDALFDELCNWGRWGAEDARGTLNYLTPERVRAAAGLVRLGRSVSLAIPINTVLGPDNASPAVHTMLQTHASPVGEATPSDLGALSFALDALACACHGDCHTHIDALCHVSYRGQLYNRQPAALVTEAGAARFDITTLAQGLVGRGVLLDVARLRGLPWLEPGEAVTAEELLAAEAAQGVRLGEGDILLFRTGHHRRRLELGAWDNSYAGEGKAGLHPTALRLLHERKVAAFLPDGDGEVVPSPVEGLPYPIHVLQIVAMGMTVADSLQFEELAPLCEQARRWEFLVVAAPLRLPGGTGSLFNPLAIL